MRNLKRPDIPIEDRIKIAAKCIVNRGQYGLVTNLAEFYNVSRQFIYMQEDMITNFFSTYEEQKLQNDIEAYDYIHRFILAARLICKASIEDISRLLKYFDLPFSSIGYISQFLNKIASNTIDDLPKVDKPVTILADEIFVNNTPILFILEAESHCTLTGIIAKNRSGETWEKCFQQLIDKGYKVKKIVKDLGSGLHKATEKLQFIAQADLFHLLYKFDPFMGSFLRAAENSIEKEEEQLRILNNRKSEAAELKAMEKYFEISQETENNIDRYDCYYFLHNELHNAFNPFEEDGTFRSKDIIYGDVMAALDLIEEEFKSYKKIQQAVDFLRKHIEEYFPYIDEVEKVLKEYEAILPEYMIKELSVIYLKRLKSFAVKEYQKAKKLYQEAQEKLDIILLIAQDEGIAGHVDKFLKNLEQCIRSSSPIEAKNSVLRQYLNACSGQISQQTLNLIVFYLNRKISTRGKYKGLSPIERLTGTKQQQHVIDIILNQTGVLKNNQKHHYFIINNPVKNINNTPPKATLSHTSK